MKMTETEQIDNLKRELTRCKESPWNSLSLLSAIIGACAIGYYCFNDSHLYFLTGGIIGLTMGSFVWNRLRITYKHLSKVYEAELDTAKKNQ
jgi:hypothetical protein